MPITIHTILIVFVATIFLILLINVHLPLPNFVRRLLNVLIVALVVLWLLNLDSGKGHISGLFRG